MRAMVGRWQSNCVGDFAGGTVYVAGSHEGVEGEYNLAQYMDGDAATIFGRDVFGEPKKIAARPCCAAARGCAARSSASGCRISLEAELTATTAPSRRPARATTSSRARPPTATASRRTRSSPRPTTR